MGNDAGTEIRRRSALTLGAVVVLALAFLLAGCSDETSSGPARAGRSTTTTTTSTAPDGDSTGTTPTTDPGSGTGAAGGAGASKPHGNIKTASPKVQDPGVLAPVPLDRPADFGNGTTVRLASVQAVQAEAKLPGEMSGPAVRIAVAITNGTGTAIDLTNVGVVLTGTGGTPAATVTSPDQAGFSGQLAPGATATGNYTFTLPIADRDDAQLTVKYSQAAPTASFEGNLPRG